MGLFQRTDSILLKQIGEGQKEAFTEFYTKYKNDVFGLCMRIMKSKNQSEEMAQEVWVKIVTKAKTFTGEDSAKSWLMTITKNTCLTEIKKSKKWALTDDIDSLDQVVETEEFSNDFWEGLEIEKAKRCLESLGDRQRVALVLFYFEEKPMTILAEELELQINAVKALLFRARKSLVACVKGVSHE